MKRITGLSSGMSSYRYPNKKTAWKWTPAKIAAFSVFGFMMVALVYFESTSSRNTYNEPVQIREQSAPLTASSNFEKEYRDFLSKGQKIVPQETLDSLNAIQDLNNTDAQDQIPDTPEPEEAVISTGYEEIRPAINQPANRPSSNNDAVTKDKANNKLETVELTPSSNRSPSTGNKTQIAGKLEESEIVENAIEKSQNQSETSPNKVIVEEFYTEETITGTISALADGTPLQGVKVAVNGTDKKATTNSTGKYSITVPGDPQHRTIRYSYLGNTTERDVAPGTSVVNVRF
jgi:hypothetical protein